MNELDYQQISKSICTNLQSMIQSTVETYLENQIGNKPSFSSLTEKGEDDMASKFNERVCVGFDENNQPIYKWVHASTKDALHQEIYKAMSGQSIKLPFSPCANTLDAECRTWESMADEWFYSFHLLKIRQKTSAKDKSLFSKHVRPAFLGKSIKAITASDVQKFLEVKSSYCKSQVRDIMSMLKQIFSLAVDEDIILKNPMASKLVFNPSKKPDKPRNALSQADQIDIISNLPVLRSVYDKYGNYTNALRFMAFLMFTGLRPCEIYGLRWEDINISKCTLSVNRDLVFDHGAGILGEVKTESSEREIPFDPRIIEYLEPIEDSGFLIHMTAKGRENEHFSEQAAVNMWNRIKRHIDVHGMTPYMGRHTFATNMNKAGVPLKTAMAIMGHKDERMLLRRYTHVDAEDLTKATIAVSSYINSSSSATSHNPTDK